MIKTNAMRILDSAKINYNVYEYPSDGTAVDGVTVAKLLNQNPDKVYKTLVTQGKSAKFHVFVIPINKELNLKSAAKAVSEKSIEMIAVSKINSVTGYVRGGCSPVGMKKEYNTIIQCDAELLDTFIVSAGKIGFQLELSPTELASFIKASFAEVCC